MLAMLASASKPTEGPHGETHERIPHVALQYEAAQTAQDTNTRIPDAS